MGNSPLINAENMRLTLDMAVEMAIENAPSARQAENNYLRAYWDHRLHRADYLPSLSMDLTLPNFNRSISGVVQPDGSEVFHERNFLRNMIGMSARQRIPYTGGQLFFSTDLERLDNFQPTEQTEYRTTPISIGLMQPLSLYNPYRWERKIAPMRYEEARRAYRKEMEQVNNQAVNSFFDAYLAEINLEIAENNLANSDTLYAIAEGRYNLGNIAENELLQMELSLLNAQNALSQAEISYQNSMFQLKNTLGIRGTENPELIISDQIPEFEVEMSVAIQRARDNRPEMISFDRQMLEAERDVAEARSGRFDVDLFAQYGLSNQSMMAEDIFSNPGDHQQFRVGVQMPLLDWGRNRARREIAASRMDLLETEIDRQEREFEHTVFMQVQEFRMNRNQLEIAARADTVAQKRFEVTQQRYLIGKISITDLNIAMNEQESARRSYVDALRRYWNSYYSLRRMTLYDFENNTELALPGRP